MTKPTYRNYAAQYRALAELAISEEQRSLLLGLAREWEAMANAAEKWSKQCTDYSALNHISGKQPDSAAA